MSIYHVQSPLYLVLAVIGRGGGDFLMARYSAVTLQAGDPSSGILVLCSLPKEAMKIDGGRDAGAPL